MRQAKPIVRKVLIDDVEETHTQDPRVSMVDIEKSKEIIREI